MTDSWEDEKLSEIRDLFGLEIYGFWWRILEIIGKKMDSTPNTSCQYSAKTWGKFAEISAKKFLKFARILAEKKLIILKVDGDAVTIGVPKMLKIRDEYSRKNRGEN